MQRHGCTVLQLLHSHVRPKKAIIQRQAAAQGEGCSVIRPHFGWSSVRVASSASYPATFSTKASGTQGCNARCDA